MHIREKNSSIEIISYVPRAISFGLLFAGIFSAVIYGEAASRASPLGHAGRHLSLIGILPILFFFLFFVTATYRNKILADSQMIILETRAFFFVSEKTCIFVEDCEGILLKDAGRKGCSLYILKDKSRFNTFLRGKKEKMEKIALKISKLSNCQLIYENKA